MKDIGPNSTAPPRRWLGWALTVLGVLCTAFWTSLAGPVAILLLAALAGLLLLAAFWSFPAPIDPVRQRLWWLLVLPTPWIAAIVLGPLGTMSGRPAPDRVASLLLIQRLAMGVSVALPLALLWPLGGARRFTAALGGLNLLPALIVMSVSTLIIDPGS